MDLKKEYFIGRDALEEEKRRSPKRLLMGLDINWDDVEALYDAIGLAPQVSSTASRVAVPVYRGGLQVGKATSTTWSPIAEKNDRAREYQPRTRGAGTELQMELTVEAVRHKVRAINARIAVFNPPRKMATPVTLIFNHR